MITFIVVLGMVAASCRTADDPEPVLAVADPDPPESSGESVDQEEGITEPSLPPTTEPAIDWPPKLLLEDPPAEDIKVPAEPAPPPMAADATPTTVATPEAFVPVPDADDAPRDNPDVTTTPTSLPPATTTAPPPTTTVPPPATTTAPPTTTTTEPPTTTTAPPPTTTTAPPVTTTIPVTVAGTSPAPEGGHPPAPELGMIPREHPYWDYPLCDPGPPWPSDCYPPSEWQTPQDLSDCFSPYPDEGVGGICASRQPDEIPRWTSDVARWTSWCFDQPRGNCTWLLYLMEWALDFLGAHPWCVLNEYQDRADAYAAGLRGATATNRHGWHHCATVIDPLVTETPAGRTNDSGLLLSDTMTLAERCRTVLPADVELESRTRRRGTEPEHFGNDCDAWSEWVEQNTFGMGTEGCWPSARLAEEWMEHHHATPEHYFPATC